MFLEITTREFIQRNSSSWEIVFECNFNFTIWIRGNENYSSPWIYQENYNYMFELVGQKNGVHLNICDWKRNRMAIGLWLCGWEKEAAEWKSSRTPQKRINLFELVKRTVGGIALTDFFLQIFYAMWFLYRMTGYVNEFMERSNVTVIFTASYVHVIIRTRTYSDFISPA